MGKFVDLTGQRFGKWTVVKRIEDTKYHEAVWLCQCDCGKKSNVSSQSLKNGTSKSCGCLRSSKIIGKRIGRITVLKKVESNKEKWLCKCDCGNLIILRTSKLREDSTKSCGCLRKEKSRERMLKAKRFYKHGLSKNDTYLKISHIFSGMKARCYNKNNCNYKYYGARGIKVCDEWMDKDSGTINFYNWAIDNGYKTGLSIDRIDVNGNYEPSNCRWTTAKIQSNNKRNNRFIEYNGETHTLSQWSRILNIPISTLYGRIVVYKKTIEEAFSMPIRHKRR